MEILETLHTLSRQLTVSCKVPDSMTKDS